MSSASRERDNQRRRQDTLREMHDKGIIQLGTFTSVHPGGVDEALKVMRRDASAVKDQSQAQREQGKDALKERAKEAKTHAEIIKDRRKKG